MFNSNTHMPLTWLKDTARDLRKFHGYKVPMVVCFAEALDHWMNG